VVEDTRGDEDFGVNDTLRGQVLDHPPCGQLVVLRADQLAGDSLEGLQEAG